MSNIIHYLFVLIRAYPVKKSIILILKYYSDDITHKSKNGVYIYIHIHIYIMVYIYICILCRIYKHINDIIGADAIGLPVLFTDCVKVIGSGGVLSYLVGD